MSPKRKQAAYDPHNDPIGLFNHFRKLSLDQSKAEIERTAARHHMMDCWSAIPWGLAADVLDIKVKS